jgi:hypothetical protein
MRVRALGNNAAVGGYFDTFQLVTSAAPVCGRAGAQNVAARRAAIAATASAFADSELALHQRYHSPEIPKMVRRRSSSGPFVSRICRMPALGTMK